MSTYETIEGVLLAAGEVFHGDRAAEIAEEWADHDFDADQVEKWVEANCWCPITASQLRDAGFRPGVDELEYKPGEEKDLGYGIDPMYALCNSDTNIDKVTW